MIENVPSTRAAVLLLWISGCLAALIYFAITLPIQTDEIAWAFVNHRAVLDDYQVMSLYPQCGTRVFPLSLMTLAYPAAWVNHLIYSFVESPFWLRLLGLTRLLGSLVLLGLIVRKISGRQALPVFAVALTFLLVDSTSVLLVMARPEQSLFLGVSLILFIALSSSAISHSPVTTKLLLASVFLLTVIQTDYAHAKAVGFVPLFIVAAILFSRQVFCSKAAHFLYPLTIGVVAILQYRFWGARLDCPDSREVQQMLFNYTLPIGQVVVAPLQFFKEAFTNFSLALMQDFWAYPERLQRGWLKSDAPSYLMTLAAVPAVLGFVLRMSTLGACLLRVLRLASGRVPVPIDETQQRYNFLAVAALCAYVPFFFLIGPTRASYLNALEVPLLLLVALLLFGREVQRCRGFRVVACTLMIVTGVNLLLHVAVYRHSDLLEVVETERLISFFAGSDDTESLRTLARACMIDPATAKHLVLDDRTYLAFRESKLPFHIHYVTDRYYSFTGYNTDADVERFFKTLALYRSDGLIVDCRNLAGQLLPSAQKKNGYCCLPAAALVPHGISGAS